VSAVPRDAGDTKRGGEDSGRNIALQWFGVLAPPVAWLLNLGFGYSLADAACHGSGMMPIHLGSIGALILAGLGGAVALANWKRAGSDWPDQSASVVQRSRILATLGLGNAALFLLIIASQWIPAFVLNPCWRT
jgi:hypothetical protein